MENAQVRLQGCRAALAAAAIPADPQLVREGNFDVNSGHEQTLALLHTSPRPTAIFLCNGPMAIGAVKALNETGVRYPDQIAVMSFDDMESFELLRPGLTAMAQPAYEMGARAAGILLDRISGALVGDDRRMLLPTVLHQRQSCSFPTLPLPEVLTSAL